MAFGPGVSNLLLNTLDAFVDPIDMDLVSFHIPIHRGDDFLPGLVLHVRPNLWVSSEFLASRHHGRLRVLQRANLGSSSFK